MRTLLRSAAAAAVLLAFAAPASAQNLNTGATGTFGQVTLNAGFEPDPHSVTVNAGGSVDASRANAACGGFIAARPSFSLRYNAGDFPLYISAASEVDTTIAVRAPDGSWSCDDDGGGNLNPLVSWESPRTGRYQIWVGRFGAQGETAPAVLNISEIGGALASGPTGDGPDFSLDPAYGSIELVSGFEPDPHRVTIAAGGEIDASSVGAPGCLGWIARAPWTTAQIRV